MDFSVIFQLKDKKFWWMDVIFYFVISLLVSTLFCYFVFLIKNNFQREEIVQETAALKTVGTDQQKKYEQDVITYRNKINDFVGLFKNHEFASNVFALMQTKTMPSVWFKQFAMDEKSREVQLSGESESMDSLSRQVVALEKDKYVQNIGALNSSLGDSARTEFNVNLLLDQSIFGYLSDMASVLEPAPIDQSSSQPGQAASAGQAGNSPASSQPSGKSITSFHILLTPEVIGSLDDKNYTVTLNVPFGTDVKNLTPAINVSPGAAISPASNIPQDFTNPVAYRVVSQDGSTQDYTVTVNILPVAVNGSAQQKNGGSNSVYIMLFIIVLIVIIAAVAIFFLLKRSKKRQIDVNKNT